MISKYQLFLSLACMLKLIFSSDENREEVPICGGFIEFDNSITPEIKKEIDYSSIQVQSFTSDMMKNYHIKTK